ncbi:arsenical pump-driving ATPase [Desulfurispirillum indicum]|uniref:arsenical pump-driving ATPase n=1 Tax=Desulfurispirillum indicum TaxID=936456 RepID=UPI001CFB2037|nr:arsenical pump-driving ATPase [Desulfurispirillum indicum]UCZ57028.1 arsenical pump-driving ATPase [Desulfurispirillum indicum]
MSEMNVTVFDPALCCSTGVCGPSVDPALAQFAAALQALKMEGVVVLRHNLAQEPATFVADERVKALMSANEQALPYIFVNGELAFASRYPTAQELRTALGQAGTAGAQAKPKTTCCGSQGLLLMRELLHKAPRFLFFTGKGGVGKTSMSCATALGLARLGRRVLLISTDPASNLDEVLETPLSSRPTPVRGVDGLDALNINPIIAAQEYRERMVGPYRGVLPDAAIAQMEEQLSGACTVEIAGFNEFAKLLGDDGLAGNYDHIVLDTAPTGHTLRLLNLPAAWNDFMADNQTGSSCLGPVSGLKEQKLLFEQVVDALKNPERTLLVLVSRAEEMPFNEAARASGELLELGLANQHLIINGLFLHPCGEDTVAQALAHRSQQALEQMPKSLTKLPSTRVPFKPAGIMGLAGLQAVYESQPPAHSAELGEELQRRAATIFPHVQPWEQFLHELELGGKGVIMTMGKGGVGKTTMAAMIAMELARRGHDVLLSTTDPAAHVADVIDRQYPNLTVDRIDPRIEVERYVKSVLEANRGKLSADDLALLEEELRSPCIEEIAIFNAFARTVARGRDQFIVLDTAPTGHTLLLLDASESYHREVAKSSEELPEEVQQLLPRIRDPRFTRMLMVSLAEATPVHEAAMLQDDLRRAGIEPWGWILNRSFALSGTADPALLAKGLDELKYIEEVLQQHGRRVALSPWIAEDLRGGENLRQLIQPSRREA